MFAAISSEMLIANFAFCALAAYFFWRFLEWIKNAPAKPDPWDAETVQKLDDPEVKQACHRCSAPQSPDAWFCPHCGVAVGPYNNVMPFLQIFSQGEVFRSGTTGHFQNRPWILFVFFLLGLAFMPVILAPFYWWSLIKNLSKKPNPAGAPDKT